MTLIHEFATGVPQHKRWIAAKWAVDVVILPKNMPPKEKYDAKRKYVAKKYEFYPQNKNMHVAKMKTCRQKKLVPPKAT